MIAKTHERRVSLYAMDLVWSIAKQYYENLPIPSEVWINENKRDTRSAKQIIADTMKKFGGE